MKRDVILCPCSPSDARRRLLRLMFVLRFLTLGSPVH